MTDTTQAVNPETQAATGQQEESAQEQPNTGQQTEWTLDAALAEIKNLRNENAKHRNAAKAAEKARADEAAKALAEQGKFKELYEQAQARLTALEPLEARVQELTERTQAANEKRINAIPETMRGLVPEYDDPFKLAQWLDANSAVFAKTLAPSLDAGAGGNVAGNAVDEAKLRAQAIRLGVDPVKYIEARK